MHAVPFSLRSKFLLIVCQYFIYFTSHTHKYVFNLLSCKLNLHMFIADESIDYKAFFERSLSVFVHCILIDFHYGHGRIFKVMLCLLASINSLANYKYRYEPQL